MAEDPGAHLSILQQVHRVRSLQEQDSPSAPPPVCVILGHSWARNLQTFLRSNSGAWTAPHFEWRVEHVSTLTHALNTRAVQRVAAYRPAVILLMLGSNDFGKTDQSKVRQNYFKLVDELLESNPRATLVCSQIERRFPAWGPPNHPLYPGLEVESGALNQAIKRRVRRSKAQNNYRVRLFQLRGAPHTPDSREKYRPDGVHLNHQGNNCLAACLSPLLCRVEAHDKTLPLLPVRSG